MLAKKQTTPSDTQIRIGEIIVNISRFLSIPTNKDAKKLIKDVDLDLARQKFESDNEIFNIIQMALVNQEHSDQGLTQYLKDKIEAKDQNREVLEQLERVYQKLFAEERTAASREVSLRFNKDIFKDDKKAPKPASDPAVETISKDRLRNLSAAGDDRTLVSHGHGRRYWYSIGDGFRLLMAIREKKLNPIQTSVPEERYSAYVKNQEGIFITDPYYLENFNTYLEDDIRKITGTHEAERVNVRWNNLPRVIIIPVLTGLHWKCVRVEIDYLNKKASILFDDPYGIGRFDGVLKQQIVGSLQPQLEKIIRVATSDRVFILDPRSIEQLEKNIDQQGRGNGYDCGCIVFGNVGDYADVNKTNQSFMQGAGYTISSADDATHEEQMVRLRSNDISEYGRVSGIAIDERRLEAIRSRMREENLRALGGKRLSSDIAAKISALLPEYISMIFIVMDELGISAAEAYESIMAEKLIGNRLSLPSQLQTSPYTEESEVVGNIQSNNTPYLHERKPDIDEMFIERLNDGLRPDEVPLRFAGSVARYGEDTFELVDADREDDETSLGTTRLSFEEATSLFTDVMPTVNTGRGRQVGKSLSSAIREGEKKRATEEEQVAKCLSLVKRGERAHIDKVEFSQTAHLLIDKPALTNFNPWPNIPRFVVITGKNGAGKSQLLGYIHRILKLHYPKLNQVFRDTAERQYNPSSNTSGSDADRFLTGESKKQLLEAARKYCIDKTHKSNFDNEQIFIDLKKKIDDGVLSNPNADGWQEQVTKYIDSYKFYQHEKHDMENPITALSTVFESFEGKKETLLREYKDLTHLEVLFTFYCKRDKKNSSDVISYKAFYRAISDADYLTDLIKDYIQEELKYFPPWEEINQVLEKYHFTYRVGWDDTKRGNEKLVFKRETVQGQIEIKHYNLSSGEKVVLDLMAWQFYFQGLSANEEEKARTKRVDIMLLDEPDSHLDPEFCATYYKIVHDELVKEHNIQVIMSTHRLDTVALAPEGSVFTMSPDNKEIKPAKKIPALFKLTGNVRELNHLRVRIYVEAHDDALFMEAIWKMSNQVRENNKRDPTNTTPMQWSALEPYTSGKQYLSRLLSRRYPLMFLSSGNSGGKDGGCRQVEILVSRDLAYREVHDRLYETIPDERKEKERLQRNYLAITKAFGVMDYDYGRYAFQNPDPSFRKRFTRLKRHSVENYLYDPFLIIGVAELSHIGEPLRSICINLRAAVINGQEKEVPALLDQYFTTLIFDYAKRPSNSSLEQNIRDKRWNLGESVDPMTSEENAIYIAKKIADKAKSLSPNQPYDRDKHFALLVAEEENEARVYKSYFEDVINWKMKITKDQKSQFELLCDIVKPESLLHYMAIERHRVARDVYAYGFQEIAVILAPDKVMKFKYPTLFLKLRGHDIEAIFPVLVGISKLAFKDLLLMRASQCKYIPFDLAEVFFELNELVRKQAEEIIGFGSERASSTEIGRLSLAVSTIGLTDVVHIASSTTTAKQGVSESPVPLVEYSDMASDQMDLAVTGQSSALRLKDKDKNTEQFTTLH